MTGGHHLLSQMLNLSLCMMSLVVFSWPKWWGRTLHYSYSSCRSLSCAHGEGSIWGVAGVSLCYFPYSKWPAAQPVFGPPHIFKWCCSAPPSLEWTRDTAETWLFAPSSLGVGLLLAALAGSSDLAHLLPSLQTMEQGNSKISRLLVYLTFLKEWTVKENNDYKHSQWNLMPSFSFW